MSSSNLMRWSGLSALAGGVLVVFYDVLATVFFPGEEGSTVMTTGSWFFLQILVLIALVLIALGLVGLYAIQAEKAGSFGLVAFVAAFIGTVMLIGQQWSESFLGPIIAEEAPGVLSMDPTGVLAAGVILAQVLFALGWLLFGLASLRTGSLPRLSSVLQIIGAVLFFVLAVFELPLFTVVFGVSVAWMGYALWSSSSHPALVSEAAI